MITYKDFILPKGRSYDIEIPFDVTGFSGFTCELFTNEKIKVVPDNIAFETGKVIVTFNPEVLDDGVLFYMFKYYIDGALNIKTTNTQMVIRTPEGYSAQTADNLYQSGITVGINSVPLQEKQFTPNVFVQDYYPDSGYSGMSVIHWDAQEWLTPYEEEAFRQGQQRQKEQLSAITITENGEYERPDGYSAITVNVAGGGQPTLQGKTLSATTNGLIEITPDQGFDGLSSANVFVDVDLNTPYNSGYTNGYASGNTDGYASGYDDGYTSGNTDGYSSGYTNGYNEGYSSGSTEQLFFGKLAKTGNIAFGFTISDLAANSYNNYIEIDTYSANPGRLLRVDNAENNDYIIFDVESPITGLNNLRVSGYTTQGLYITNTVYSFPLKTQVKTTVRLKEDKFYIQNGFVDYGNIKNSDFGVMSGDSVFTTSANVMVLGDTPYNKYEYLKSIRIHTPNKDALIMPRSDGKLFDVLTGTEITQNDANYFGFHWWNVKPGGIVPTTFNTIYEWEIS